MKKLIFFLIFLILIINSTFAAIKVIDHDAEVSEFLYEGLSDRNFTFFDPRVERQGGAGIISSYGVSALFHNPANLANRKSRRFKLNLPSVSVNIYNVAKVMDIDGIETLFKDLFRSNDDSNDADILDTLIDLYSEFGYGDIPLINVNADAGFSVAGFAVDVFLKLTGHVHNATGITSDLRVTSETAVGAAFGFAKKFNVDDRLNISIGVSAIAVSRSYIKSYSTSDLETMTNSIGSFLLEREAVSVFQMPINIGINAQYAPFTFSILYKDINFSDSTVYLYDSYNDYFKNFFASFSGGSSKSKVAKMSPVDKKGLPGSFNVGFGFDPNLGVINLKGEIDFVNLFNFSNTTHYDYSNLFSHIKLGAELQLLNTIFVGAGLDQGRITFGATLDLFPIIIDVDYGWVERTKTLAESMSDRFTVSIKLGWDR